MKKLFVIIGLLSAFFAVQASRPYRVSSPDGKTQVRIYLSKKGAPCMEVKVDGKEVLRITDIGYKCADSLNLADGYRVTNIDKTIHVCDTQHYDWGQNKTVVQNYTSACVRYLNTDNVRMDLRIFVSNEGVGFRTEVHVPSGSHKCLNENTTYHFAHDGTCWSIPANFESYEFAYRQQPLSATKDANTPMTIKMKNGKDSLYCYLHELQLIDMPEMTLVQDSLDHLAFHTWLCPDNSGTGTSFDFSGAIYSAERSITFGHKAVDLINSNHQYCNPWSMARKGNMHRPIKYVGVWWGMHLGINSWVPDSRHGATTQNALRYIDFASQNNINGVLFEGWNQGWEQWGGRQDFDFLMAAPDFDLQKVVDYAHEKGVDIIMHHETGGNIPNYENQMEKAFQWCQEHDIHYVKTGYAGGFPDHQLHHSQYGVRHYERVVQLAAQYDVSLDVHEPIKPTNRCCNYPNLMSGEGARGMEWNAWSDGNSPAHTTILPFTRLLAGPMDYTPGIFDITYERIKGDPNCKKWNQKDAQECRVHTTLAKQCALWVVIYSPMVMAADLIENYEGHPMFQFFRDYNPDCDWSRALQGEPGEYVATVRRAGSSFYLGAITNEDARTLNIPLDFLPEGKTFDVTVYGDAADADYRTNPTAYSITHQRLTSKDVLTLRLASGGGSAVSLIPEK